MTLQIHHRQAPHGFALVVALFLIVVLAGLGLFAVRLASSQQQTINLALLGSRAQAAANSGLEYAANRASPPLAPVCNNVTTFNLNQAALKGFTVSVTCTPSLPLINGSAPGCPANKCGVYELTATATYSIYGKPDYVSRKAWRTVSKVPVP